MVRLLVIVLALTFSASVYAGECGNFKVVKGKVEYKRTSKSKLKKARVNKKVCAGGRVITSDGARAKIVMAGGNELNISPKSEVVIEAYKHEKGKKDNKAILNVIYGKLRSNVKQKYNDDKQSHYRVKTKSAVAGVRGTEFLMSFNERSGQSRVVTFEGKVEFSKFDGGQMTSSVLVEAGHFSSNGQGGNPHEPKQVPPKELAQMDRDSSIDSGGAERGVTGSQPAATQEEKDKEEQPEAEQNQPESDKKEPEKKEPDQAANDPKEAPEADKKEPSKSPNNQAGNKSPSDDGANPNRQPANSGGLLPPPELPDDIAGADGALPPPAPFQPPELPDDRIQDQVRDVIQNKKSRLKVYLGFE